ncbi:MAG: hypothetical protein IJ834_05695 [Paludibacteraceae bacterium]|nr:hypothetical protein [Paludibacteraceae bacterium]
MMKEENILDSEIRVIGGNQKPAQKLFLWRLITIIVAVIAIIGLVVWWLRTATPNKPVEPSLFEHELTITQPHPLVDWFASIDTITAVGTITKEISINDIPLNIYAPLNSTPHLEVGYNIVDNCERSILFFQAADVRADNGKIVGAFVLNGKPLSWGLSKRGFCAIIDGDVTVGVADNSPLFEKATETGGDFFRQYPLVDKGNLVESELKSKAIRRALCEVEGHVVVVETQTTESMHDFAQALVDIGTANAIYLVGSSAMGWSMDTDGNGTKMGLWDTRKIKNISFIVWAK